MRKFLKLISLALVSLVGTTTADAQRSTLIATTEGTAAASLEELATLAENHTPVMLWNNGRGRYIQNTPNSSGDLFLALYDTFEAGTPNTSSMLWRLEKADGENSYHFVSLVDGKYMHMSGGPDPALCTTVAPDEGTPETFTAEVNDASTQTFNFVGANATQERGQTLYLNGNGTSYGRDAATVVAYTSPGGNSAYRIMIPETREATLYTVNYTYNFFDGNSDTPLADAGLDDLTPTVATYSVEAEVGDTVTLPAFDNTAVRRAMAGAVQVTDSATFCLTEEMIADGNPTLAIDYTVNPRITFVCTMDLSEIGGAEGEYIFDNGDVATTVYSRFAVGDTIVAPTLANFTALTEYDGLTATTSGELEAVYRPWRQITLNCSFLIGGETPSTIRNISQYVDLGDTIAVPDMGEMYTFDEAATAEISGINFPIVVEGSNIFNGQVMDIFYSRNVPFELSTINEDGTLNQATATWYVVRFRGSKIMTDVADDEGMLILDANATIDDHTLWAIAETTDGSGSFVLFNKANPDKVFCDNSGGLYPPALVTPVGGEMGFDLVNITNGYGLRLSAYYGEENMMLNDYENAGHLGYWNSSAAWNDAGSTITFEVYDTDNYTFITGRSYLNAQDCVGGFTAEQLADVRAYVEEGDPLMEGEVDYICEFELATLPAEDRVQFNPDHVYAIMGAAPEFIQQDNAQYALCFGADSVLSWKEFTDASDKDFQFVLKQQILKAQDGTDSICYSFYHVGSGLYVNDHFHFLTSPGFGNEETYFWARPVLAETDDEGNVTRSYLPAAFYIKKWVYYDWTLPADDPDNFPVEVTWSMFSGGIDKTVSEGDIVSYNQTAEGYATMFRFKDLGTPEQVGIGSVTADCQAAGDGKLYDLSGRQLQSEPRKGIFIKNGKAVLK